MGPVRRFFQTPGHCVYCNAKIDADKDYQLVTGWVKRRNQGGTNALALRTPRNKWACCLCIDGLKRGVSPQQSRLI